MSPTEKLARRICWLGFGRLGRIGKTEATYWASLPRETHESYEFEAALLVGNLHQLNRSASSQALLSEARRAYAKRVGARP